MPESHRFIIDRHEGDLAVVEVDGGPVLDLPRWLLPHAARPDDVLAVSVERHRDGVPFYMVALIFLSAFGTLAISFWPYMIPYVITVEEAAAPHSSLAFMFWGEGLFVYPLMLIYTVISYRVFRGKVRATPMH